MSITPVALASITAAVSVLGTEYLKGLAAREINSLARLVQSEIP